MDNLIAKECEFRGIDSCSEKPGGLGGIAHCLTCWLENDRRQAREKAVLQSREAIAMQSRFEIWLAKEKQLVAETLKG